MNDYRQKIISIGIVRSKQKMEMLIFVEKKEEKKWKIKERGEK